MIHFYKTKEEYGCFSNFARFDVFVDGKRWPTSEHYFQAMKHEGTPVEEAIRKSETPREAASLGRNCEMARKDWDMVRLVYMYRVVRAKFEQHPELATKLLGTGEQQIAEHASVDSFWADGGDGTGQNWLGKILMMVREDLRCPTRTP